MLWAAFLVSGVTACAPKAAVQPETVIQIPAAVRVGVLLLNDSGDPLFGVTLRVNGREVVAPVPYAVAWGPVVLSASKPGYSTTRPAMFMPGEHTIVLYRMNRAD